MKKESARLLIFILVMAFVMSCTFNKGEMKMNNPAIFAKGDRGPDAYFSHTVWVKMLHTDEKGLFDTQVYNVTFEPSARTYWHSHPGGQILLVTHGTGYYQEKGKPAQLLKPGDTVAIPPDVVHWHGASPDSEFVHLGMSTQVKKGPAKWLGPVTDQEYAEATAR